MSKKLIKTVALLLIALLFSSGCVLKASNTDTTVTQNIEIIQTTNEPTETAVVTTPTQKADVTSATTVKETTAATTTAVETTAPAATTKITTAPVATTKSTTSPASTTKAPVATTAATTQATTVATTATTVATTAAPATDYTAVCAAIRSKLIAILEANGQWDEAFTGESTNSGSQWWGVGFYDDREMSIDDFAQHFYANKFAGMAKCGTSITCYMADGNINIAYTAYWTS